MELRLGVIKSIPKGLFYDNLNRALWTQLMEVAKTTNRVAQSKFISKVRTWYYSCLTKEQLNLIQLEESDQDQLTSFKPQDLPKSAYRSSLADYWNNYRSTHNNIEPAEDRVKTYQRKNLLSSQCSTRPQTSQQETFSQNTRPLSSQYRMSAQIMKMKERPNTNQKQSRMQSYQPSPSKRVNSEFSQGEESNQRQRILSEKREFRGDLNTNEFKFKQFTSDTETVKLYKEPLPQGEPYSTFLTHKKDDEQNEVQLAQLSQDYYNRKNKEVQDQREDEEMLTRINEWVVNKGRVDEMILQKNLLQQDASKFKQTGIKMSQIFTEEETLKRKGNDSEFANLSQVSGKQRRTISSILNTINYQNIKPRQCDKPAVEHFQVNKLFYLLINIKEKFIGLEQRIKLDQYNQLKQSRSNWLPGGGFKQVQLNINKPQFSSAYSQTQNIKLADRTFSGVFRKSSQHQFIRQQEDEIKQVKLRLASAQKSVSSDKLKKSLQIPSGLIDPTSVGLPEPGAGIMEFPTTTQIKKPKKKKLKK